MISAPAGVRGSSPGLKSERTSLKYFEFQADRIPRRNSRSSRCLRRDDGGAQDGLGEQFLESARARSGGASADLGNGEGGYVGGRAGPTDQGADLCGGQHEQPMRLL